MKFQIPPSLKAEHEELHGELARATRAGGRTGEAAKAVAKLMHPHFVKEEEYARRRSRSPARSIPPFSARCTTSTSHSSEPRSPRAA
jgi:hypothetical protein